MSLLSDDPELLRLAKRVAEATASADVVELIRRVPLDNSFAAKLPTAQRSAFKKLVESMER